MIECLFEHMSIILPNMAVLTVLFYILTVLFFVLTAPAVTEPVTTVPVVPLPVAPSNLTAIIVSNRTLDVTWTYPSSLIELITSFEVSCSVC